MEKREHFMIFIIKYAVLIMFMAFCAKAVIPESGYLYRVEIKHDWSSYNTLHIGMRP